ncbi:MAG: hypothetical protein JRJ65_14195 [Deltaproteobacteria bacterium]|nr:hypothetical protein [Deltaproteobacteria bacterium]
MTGYKIVPCFFYWLFTKEGGFPLGIKVKITYEKNPDNQNVVVALQEDFAEVGIVGLTQVAVGYAADRGKKLVEDMKIDLDNKVS